jgi:hypothetical protein
MDSIVKTYQPPTPPLAAAEGRPCTAQHTSGTIHPVMSEPAFDHDEEVAGLVEGATSGTRLGTGRREVDDFGAVVRTRCVTAPVWIGVVECASPCTRARPAGAWWRPVASSCGPRPAAVSRAARERGAGPAASWQILHERPHRFVESCSVRAPPLAEREAGRILRDEARGVRPGDHRPSDLRDQGPCLAGLRALAPIRGSRL